MKFNCVIHYIVIYPKNIAIDPLINWGQISKEALFRIYKVPTHGEYLIEHDSIGPPATQKTM